MNLEINQRVSGTQIKQNQDMHVRRILVCRGHALRVSLEKECNANVCVYSDEGGMIE